MPKPNQIRLASKIGVRAKTPSSIDENKRSCLFVISTENPVRVFDWGLWREIDEVLLMSGCILPTNNSVPLLDTHSRHSTKEVLGSCTDFETKDGELLAKANFSSVQKADDAFTLVREGHLTDVSVGYEIIASIEIKENENYEHEGKTYTGPMRLVSSWKLKEVSLCPIGADPDAKARNKINLLEDDMPNKNSLSKRNDDILDDENKEENQELETEKVEEEGEENLESKSDEKEDETKADSSDSDDEKERSESQSKRAIRLEKERCMNISAICRKFDVAGNFENEWIEKNYSVDKVRSLVLDSIANKSEDNMPGFRVEQGKQESEKVREAATDGLMLRCGLLDNSKAKDNGSNHFRSMTLRELAREILFRSGQNIPDELHTMLGRALTTTDLPIILTEAVNKALIAGWGGSETTYQHWCGEGQVADFRQQTLAKFSMSQTLDFIPEGGEYKYSKADEDAETVQIGTYGKIIPITRQALINDDLSVFSTIPMLHGEAAAKTINKLAYDVLKNNKAMQDGKALFSADHKNLISKTAGVPDATKLGLMFKAMKTQKDKSGELLQAIPRFFIAPVSLESASETFFQSEFLGTQANPNQKNIYAGTKLQRFYDPLLDLQSEADWFLAGNKGNTVTLFFLNGVKTPRLEEKQGWSIDGVELKVSIDAAAAPVGYQYLSKTSA